MPPLPQQPQSFVLMPQLHEHIAADLLDFFIFLDDFFFAIFFFAIQYHQCEEPLVKDQWHLEIGQCHVLQWFLHPVFHHPSIDRWNARFQNSGILRFKCIINHYRNCWARSYLYAIASVQDECPILIILILSYSKIQKMFS